MTPDRGDDVVRFLAVHATAIRDRDILVQAYRARTGLLATLSPAAWQALDESSALRALDTLLRFDQAFLARMLDGATSAAFVADLLALAGEPRSWHTLATFTEQTAVVEGERRTLLVATGWYGTLRGATFDTGFVVVGIDRSVVVWFADED